MTTQARFRTLSVSIFGATVSGVLFVHQKVPLEAAFGRYSPIVLVLASLISYALIFKSAVAAVESVATLKKIYWGKLYIDGLWSYTSFSDGKEFRGVWRIEQDVLGFRVVAFGLDDDFRRRSTVHSISGLRGEAGVYEVVNWRWDQKEDTKPQFSRTRLVPDKPVRHFLFSYPDVIRGETVIYGGVLDGVVNRDLRMQRRSDCRTEEDVIRKLKEEAKR